MAAIGIGILLFELGGDDGGIGGRSLEGDAILETGETVKVVTATPHFALAGRIERDPVFGGALWGEMKIARKDTDDDIRQAIEDDCLAQNCGLRAVAILPGSVA